MVTEEMTPIFQSFWALNLSAIASPLVALSIPRPITPECVLYPEERLIAVLAESGQKEVAS